MRFILALAVALFLLPAQAHADMIVPLHYFDASGVDTVAWHFYLDDDEEVLGPDYFVGAGLPIDQALKDLLREKDPWITVGERNHLGPSLAPPVQPMSYDEISKMMENRENVEEKWLYINVSITARNETFDNRKLKVAAVHIEAKRNRLHDNGITFSKTYPFVVPATPDAFRDKISLIIHDSLLFLPEYLCKSEKHPCSSPPPKQ